MVRAADTLSTHYLMHDTEPFEAWWCTCGQDFGGDEESAMEHRRGGNSPESRLLNCIAKQTHYSQPIEIVYEMRGQWTAAGTPVASPVEGSAWLRTNQTNAERSRVTVFGCPNCGHQDSVKW